VLSAVRGSEINDMAVGLALRCLDEEVRAVDGGQHDNAATQRGRQFYTILQDISARHLRFAFPGHGPTKLRGNRCDIEALEEGG